MSKFGRMARSRAAFSGVIAAVVAAAAPTSASAGFLDQLFGGGTITPVQPSFNYQPQQSAPDLQIVPVKPRAHARTAAYDEAPVRQKTTDLWHDKTLRPGDAIMMKDGLHVFKGFSASLHNPKEFVPLGRARSVSSKERAALVAMDTMHNDPLRGSSTPDTLASGRSAAVAVPVTKGIRITDARGASVRYVGP